MRAKGYIPPICSTPIREDTASEIVVVFRRLLVLVRFKNRFVCSKRFLRSFEWQKRAIAPETFEKRTGRTAKGFVISRSFSGIYGLAEVPEETWHRTRRFTPLLLISSFLAVSRCFSLFLARNAFSGGTCSSGSVRPRRAHDQPCEKWDWVVKDYHFTWLGSLLLLDVLILFTRRSVYNEIEGEYSRMLVVFFAMRSLLLFTVAIRAKSHSRDGGGWRWRLKRDILLVVDDGKYTSQKCESRVRAILQRYTYHHHHIPASFILIFHLALLLPSSEQFKKILLICNNKNSIISRYNSYIL